MGAGHAGRILTGLILSVAASSPPARPDDTAAVDGAMQRARAHVKAERWSSAVDGYRKLLANNVGSKTVLDRLSEIEADLRKCLFRMQAKHPAAEALFGAAARGLNVNERRLTLDYPEGPKGTDWMSRPSGSYHAIPFDSDIAVEFHAPTIDSASKAIVTVWLHEVPPGGREDLGGYYRITPGACSEDEKYNYLMDGTITRWDPPVAGKETFRTLVEKPTPGKVTLGQVQTYRIVRRDSGFNVSVDGKPFLVCQDGKYRVLKVALQAARIGKLTLRGVVERTYYLDVLNRRYAVEQRAWETNGYVRAEVLPKWVLEAAPAGAEAPEPGADPPK